jgi:sulfhydrogenase subunit beta (sulfur reductase)
VAVVEAVVGGRYLLDRSNFPAVFDRLRSLGYRVVGPTLRDGAIVYGELASEADLPIGWTDRPGAGQYRLERRTDGALFGYNVGPHSWKKYLFPARERLWTAERAGASFTVTPEVTDPTPLAFLGVRACELAAIEVQDRVFQGGTVDPSYRSRRSNTLTIAVQCGQAASTCFCPSMGTGPRVRSGYDLSFTELIAPGSHTFLIEVGTERGREVLRGLPTTVASEPSLATAEELLDRTTASMGRSMDTTGIRDLLVLQPQHPRWEIVARRCLSCSNCTLACPTCFCHSTEEVPSLDQEKVERWRRWDSCFNSDLSSVHGAPVRASTSARYRQWLTHKLATWHDQFGSSGCVGCGRCITWCPVGIDLTEEVAAIRSTAPVRVPP